MINYRSDAYAVELGYEVQYDRILDEAMTDSEQKISAPEVVLTLGTMYNMTLTDAMKSDMFNMLREETNRKDTDSDGFLSRDEMKNVLRDKGKEVLR